MQMTVISIIIKNGWFWWNIQITSVNVQKRSIARIDISRKDSFIRNYGLSIIVCSIGTYFANQFAQELGTYNSYLLAFDELKVE